MRGQGNPRGGKRQDAVRETALPVDEESDKPERAPSFLSARELQAPKPAKGTVPDDAGERTPEPGSKKR
jgi:hypothetical protein